MEIKILVITGEYSYKNDFQKASSKRSVIVEYAKTMADATLMLIKAEYCLVVIRVDTVDYKLGLSSMREIQEMPILLISYNEFFSETGSAENSMQVFILTPYSMDYLAEASAAMARYYLNIKGTKAYVNPSVFIYKSLMLIEETHQVFCKDTKILLTKKEFDLLKYFMANRGTTLTYEQIYNSVWGYDHNYETNNILHSLIRRLRKKLNCEPDSDDYLKSIWEIGYKFGTFD